MNDTQYMNEQELQSIKIEDHEQGTVKITGEIPFSYLEKERSGALKELGAKVRIDGFRAGHIPEKVLMEHVGEMSLLGEMAERALAKAYPAIVRHHKLEVIGYPNLSLTKLAKDNPLGFTAIVAIMPKVTLPDFKKIAKEKNAEKESTEVTDAEVDEQVQDILRQKAAYERLQKKAGSHDHAHDHDHDHEGHDHTHDHGAHEHADEKDETPLEIPELTDEFVKTLGTPGQFENVEDFKKKVREHLEIQKKEELHSKHRASITDAIIEKTEVVLPQVMIDTELNQMFAQMEEDLKRAELKIDDYLTHIKKTRDDLKKDWTPSAEKRAKLQLVLNEIAEQEKITSDAGLIDQEISGLLERYKDADEARVRIYVASVLTNEAVMKMLESQ